MGEVRYLEQFWAVISGLALNVLTSAGFCHVCPEEHQNTDEAKGQRKIVLKTQLC